MFCMTDFSDFIELVHATRDKQLLADLFAGITTDKERRELARRLEVIRRLLDNEAQAKIASDLGVGIATVTRGSKELAQGRFKVLRKMS